MTIPLYLFITTEGLKTGGFVCSHLQSQTGHSKVHPWTELIESQWKYGILSSRRFQALFVLLWIDFVSWCNLWCVKCESRTCIWLIQNCPHKTVELCKIRKSRHCFLLINTRRLSLKSVIVALTIVFLALSSASSTSSRLATNVPWGRCKTIMTTAFPKHIAPIKEKTWKAVVESSDWWILLWDYIR